MDELIARSKRMWLTGESFLHADVYRILKLKDGRRYLITRNKESAGIIVGQIDSRNYISRPVPIAGYLVDPYLFMLTPNIFGVYTNESTHCDWQILKMFGFKRF